jgi:2-C-methyl-D-erythritol 4-phosphate cytidylyltransferase
MAGLKKYVLIVAGGYGSRMGSDVPKQFISIAGKPILIHTFEAFLKYSQDLIFILILPADQIDNWRKICVENSFSTPHIIKEGGATRFQSVKKGLEIIKEDGLVAIHDGVRPCVPQEVISSSFLIAKSKGSAIASVSIRESIRKVVGNNSQVMNRNDFVVIQTPQTFPINLIQKAYEIHEQDFFTDDASVYETAGMPVNLIEGSYSNIKITTKDDLRIAEAFLTHK